MMNMGQGLGRGVVAAVGVLLLGYVGCTKTLERKASPRSSSSDTLATTSEAGTAPTQAAAPSSDDALALATEAPPDESGSETVAREAAPIEPLLRVHEIRLANQDGRRALVVSLSRPPDDVSHFRLSSPNRVVIDLAGPISDVVRTRTYPVADPGVARVRVGTHEGKLRLVADLEGPLPETAVETHDRSIVALLGPQEEGPADQVVYTAPDLSPAVTADRADATAWPGPETQQARAAETVDPQPVTPAVDAAASDAPEAEAKRAAADPEPVAAPDPEPVAAADERAYAMPIRATVKRTAEAHAKGAPPTHTIEGGMITSLPPGDQAPRAYTGQRISLDFKDADIQNVLRILADVSGLNIITTEDVGGKLTMRLVNVPWDQALDAILQAKGLDMVRDGNIVRISSVDTLKKERDAQRAANEALTQVEPLQVKYIKVNYAKADEKLVKKLEEKVLTERGTATWDERTNTIVVKDIGTGIGDAEAFIREFDTQTPQVLIEANIVEATDTLVRDLGVQWGYTYKAGPATGNPTGVNFPGTIDAGGKLSGGLVSPSGVVPFIADFPANIAPGAGSAFDVLLGSLDGSKALDARLTALEREGKGKIISRPRVVTLNNVPAKIEALRILRVRLPSTGTVISTGAGGVAGTAQNATEQIRTGITLQVTPQVSSDGFVFIDVYVKSSTPDFTRQVDNIPDEVSREAESHVLIRDGETFVLGGVFRNELNQNDRGIPYLKDIPVLGWAFKNNLHDDARQELLVFITPRAVRARGTENLASLPSAETLWQNRGNP